MKFSGEKVVEIYEKIQQKTVALLLYKQKNLHHFLYSDTCSYLQPLTHCRTRNDAVRFLYYF